MLVSTSASSLTQTPMLRWLPPSRIDWIMVSVLDTRCSPITLVFTLHVSIVFAGNTLFLRRITQELVIVDPPEKLVLEVDSARAYLRLNWERNGVHFSPAPSAAFPITSEKFFYFFDVYVTEPTAEIDLGLYVVELNQAGSQDTTGAPDQSFTVVPYGKPLTVAVYFASSADNKTIQLPIKPSQT